MRILHPMIIIAAFCGIAAGAEPAARVDAFSKLKQGDSLMVHFHSRGCFHGRAYELTFRRASKVTVSVVRLAVDSSEVSRIATNRVDLSTLTLSTSDVGGLDRLLKFYRSTRRSGCTTVDHISLRQQRNGETVAVEQFVDSSCQSYEKKLLTTFYGLIQRAHSQK
jgi:hypothetical protein